MGLEHLASHLETDTDLSNRDIAALPPSRRRWNARSFFALWAGMSINIPSYWIAASLIDEGMNWWQALLTVFLGNLIVFAVLSLSGHAGAKYGIPFPVLARAAFGVRGSHLPVLLRAIAGCAWFGIQTWIGGTVIYAIVLTLWPYVADGPAMTPDGFGTSLIEFSCFMVFWAMNMLLIRKGIESIRIFAQIAAPFLLLGSLALLAWAYRNADGAGPILEAGSAFRDPAGFRALFWPSLAAMAGLWSLMSLNISDFTRHVKSQRAQVLGQLAGLPGTMTWIAFTGIAVTSAGFVIYGETIWDPVALVKHFESPALVCLALFAILIAVLSTNAAANLVGPAYAFSSLAPSRIDFRRGGYLAGVIGIVMMPWQLIADPGGHIFTILTGFAVLLGPVIGIILADYLLIRKTVLDVEDLYRSKGRYAGVNPAAVIAFAAGIAPGVPGLLASLGLYSGGGAIVEWYHYAWFTGLGTAGVVYYVLMRQRTG